MAPILGIYASSIVPSLQNSYESIATSTVGSGGTASVTFSSIPQTYSHLQIRGFGRTGAAYESDAFNIQFNGDTGNNYGCHYLQGDSVNASASSALTQSNLYVSARMPGSTVTSGIFGSAIIDILDYTNTNKNKTIRSLSGFDMNNTSAVVRVALMSGLWSSTSAITSITILANSGNLQQYSSFALYGMKG